MSRRQAERWLRSLAVLFVSLGVVGIAHAAAEGTLVMVLLRALTYDRAKVVKPGTELVLGIAYDPGKAASLREHRTLVDALASKGLKYEGKPVRVTSVAVGSDTTPSEALEKTPVQLLLIVDGLDDRLPDLLEASRAAKVLPMTLDEERVKAGVPLGVVLQDGRPKIIVNLKAAKAWSMDLSAALLQLAKVVG